MENPVIIGDCTLYLGDCREILPTLGKVDAVVTSPPYNQLENLNGEPSGLWADKKGGLGFVKMWQDAGYKDDMDENDYQLMQNELFSMLNVRESGSLFYNHQIRWRNGVAIHPVDWFKPKGWKLRSEIIWDRCGGMMFNARMFCRFDERVFWFVRGNKHKWNQSSVGLGTVWRIPPAQHKEHPVGFPIEIPENCIAAATDHFDIVMDPFMGSGTTGVACVNLGRKFIGIEIEPKYFDIACRRIADAVSRPRLALDEPKNPEQTVIPL